MSYSEKLKDPRWQKKRLEILSRDEFTCRYCGAKTKTLHVHHFGYSKSGNPWDVDDLMLITLCEDCHYVEEMKLPDIIIDILSVVRTGVDILEDEGVNAKSLFIPWIIEIILEYYPKKNG